jgi:hypothetical protein
MRGGGALGVAEGEADSEARGVIEGVCLIPVSRKNTEGEGDRQIRSLSSKFRSDSNGFSPNSHSRLERVLATDSDLSREGECLVPVPGRSS